MLDLFLNHSFHVSNALIAWNVENPAVIGTLGVMIGGWLSFVVFKS